MSSTVPTRSEVPDSDKWDLSHLFIDTSKWQEDFAWLQRTYPKFQEWKGKVGESAQTLAAVLEFEKSLELKMERVYHYASLQLAEDSTNNEYLARIGQVQNLLTKIGEAAAFVVPEILAIDDEKFAQFVADPVLKDWRIKLQKIRRMKPHVLSEAEERILALGNVALSGYDDTFSQLTDVDMKFGALVDEKGREKPLTQSSFSSFLVKRDPVLRKRAFHQFYAEFHDRSFGISIYAGAFLVCTSCIITTRTSRSFRKLRRVLLSMMPLKWSYAHWLRSGRNTSMSWHKVCARSAGVIGTKVKASEAARFRLEATAGHRTS